MTDGGFLIESRCYPVGMEILAPGYLPYRVRDVFPSCPLDAVGISRPCTAITAVN